MHAQSTKAVPVSGRAVLQTNLPGVALSRLGSGVAESSWKNPFANCHQARLLLASYALILAVIQANAPPLREAGERNAAAEGHDLEQARQQGLREATELSACRLAVQHRRTFSPLSYFAHSGESQTGGGKLISSQKASEASSCRASISHTEPARPPWKPNDHQHEKAAAREWRRPGRTRPSPGCWSPTVFNFAVTQVKALLLREAGVRDAARRPR